VNILGLQLAKKRKVNLCGVSKKKSKKRKPACKPGAGKDRLEDLMWERGEETET